MLSMRRRTRRTETRLAASTIRLARAKIGRVQHQRDRVKIGGEAVRQRRRDPRAEKPAQGLREDRQQHRLAHQDRGHLGPAEAQDAQARQFAGPFAQLDARAVIGHAHGDQ
jgi:hypothetical protein